jgi:phosphatidylinositol kinase/protein kinase (PI-3  family)
MPRLSHLSLREDLHNFCRFSERLLASAQGSDHSPFSQEELQMLCHYANEVTKLADAQRLEQWETRNEEKIGLGQHNSSLT